MKYGGDQQEQGEYKDQKAQLFLSVCVGNPQQFWLVWNIAAWFVWIYACSKKECVMLRLQNENTELMETQESTFSN